MPNHLYQFPDNVPPPNIQIYWCKNRKSWRIWFGDDPPMFEYGEYKPFKGKLYDYTKTED